MAVQHRDLPAGQLQRYPVPGGGAARRIQRQSGPGQHRRPGAQRAPGQRAQVREQDRVGERLGQVVVRPAVQAFGVVQVVVHRGEHQDRRPPARLAQPRGHLVAVQARQHHVQDDDVVGVLGRLPQPVDAVVRHVDDIALGRQPPRQGVGRVPLVLDQQQTHDPSSPGRHAHGHDAGNPRIIGTISAMTGSSSVSVTLRAVSQALPGAGAALAIWPAAASQGGVIYVVSGDAFFTAIPPVSRLRARAGQCAAARSLAGSMRGGSG